MNLDAMDFCEDLSLLHEVAEIAMGVLANAGRCELFEKLDRAVDSLDVEQMLAARGAFQTLPADMQQDLLHGSGTAEGIAEAVRLLEAGLADSNEGAERLLA